MFRIRFAIVRHSRDVVYKHAEGQLLALDGALAEGIARLEAALNWAIGHGDVPQASRCRSELRALVREGYAARATRASAHKLLLPAATPRAEPAAMPRSATGATTYWISSSTLANAHAHLTRHLPGTAQEPEWMLAVSGLRIGAVRTLESLIAIRLEAQSGARAAFDMRHFTEVAVSLAEHGQALHGVFHSHRFFGQPQPSSTDWRLQSILEEGGYPAIQAVFSEDGYVCFFAQRRPFRVEVYGKGVERVKESVFRIVQLGTLPHPTPATEARGSVSA